MCKSPFMYQPSITCPAVVTVYVPFTVLLNDVPAGTPVHAGVGYFGKAQLPPPEGGGVGVGVGVGGGGVGVVNCMALPPDAAPSLISLAFAVNVPPSGSVAAKKLEALTRKSTLPTTITAAAAVSAISLF